MQNACMLEKRAQTEALNLLVSELFVTVLRRDVTIHESWCTFCYGTAQRWEEKQISQVTTQDEREAEQILLRQLSQKQVNSLLKSR